jgi:hypothetical protein
MWPTLGNGSVGVIHTLSNLRSVAPLLLALDTFFTFTYHLSQLIRWKSVVVGLKKAGRVLLHYLLLLYSYFSIIYQVDRWCVVVWCDSV